MTTYRIKTPTGIAIMTCADVYRFEGYVFEFHHFCGPCLLRRDGSERAKQPGVRSRFWESFERWQKLSLKKKERTKA